MDVIRRAAENAGLKVIDYGLVFDPPLAESRSDIDHVIVHHDIWPGGTMADIHNDHQEYRGYRGTGYHVRIRTDGTVELGRPFGMVGGHCNQQKMNYKSVGLVFEGNFDKNAMGLIQFEAGSKFLAEFTKLTDIKSEGIQPHNVYAPKTCPGRLFDLTGMISMAMLFSSKSDDSVSEWAKPAQQWVINQGVSDGSRPKDNCTREEMWTMLHNMYGGI